jgi:hypothetical protein
VTGDGVVPFLIAWEGGEHPSTSAPPAGRLISLRAEHPDAAAVRRALRALDVSLAVAPARQAALIATIETARGLLEVR